MRKATLAILIWCALTVILAYVASQNECAPETHQDACAVSTGFGILFVLAVGILGLVVLSIVWFVTRPKKPPQSDRAG